MSGAAASSVAVAGGTSSHSGDLSSLSLLGSSVTSMISVGASGTGFASAPASSGGPNGVSVASNSQLMQPSPNIGAIAGGAIGGALFVIFLVWLLLWLRKRRRRKDTDHLIMPMVDAHGMHPHPSQFKLIAYNNSQNRDISHDSPSNWMLGHSNNISHDDFDDTALRSTDHTSNPSISVYSRDPYGGIYPTASETSQSDFSRPRSKNQAEAERNMREMQHTIEDLRQRLTEGQPAGDDVPTDARVQALTEEVERLRLAERRLRWEMEDLPPPNYG